MANQNKNNVDLEEIEKFNLLAHKWWDPTSEFKPLHEINPLRLNFIKSSVNLKGKKVLMLVVAAEFFQNLLLVQVPM
jgi:2-polyprenyl-6-hydroxyphenyl methylase/3-demethylubiquinone-9 3-methyltransferase